MWDLFSKVRKRGLLLHSLVGLCLVSLFVQVQIVQAMSSGTSCMAAVTAHAHHAKAHSCCDSSPAPCGCELKQGNATEAAEPALTPSSGLSNPESENQALSAVMPEILSTNEQIVVNPGIKARGPTVKVYLQTLNLIC
jgi:hypothetical protein